jgi:Na+-transporting NADH:ubiquinone oxidoreductase subunit NqrD
VIAITKGVGPGLSYESISQWVEASRDMIGFGKVTEPIGFLAATEVGRLMWKY